MGTVEKEFGKKLLLTDLLQAPTIEELVALVDWRRRPRRGRL